MKNILLCLLLGLSISIYAQPDSLKLDRNTGTLSLVLKMESGLTQAVQFKISNSTLDSITSVKYPLKRPDLYGASQSLSNDTLALYLQGQFNLAIARLKNQLKNPVSMKIPDQIGTCFWNPTRCKYGLTGLSFSFLIAASNGYGNEVVSRATVSIGECGSVSIDR